MSTVSKQIADRIIAGDFPEDEVYLIIRYENAFNGNYAYKLYYSQTGIPPWKDITLEIFRIYGDNLMTYWIDEKKFPAKDIAVFKSFFPQVERNEPSRNTKE